jgi:hypothetical protein
MEKVTLNINQGIFSVEELIAESDKENIYVLYVVVNSKGESEWSVGFAPIDDKDRIYISVTDKKMEQAIISDAFPILLNALEIKTIQSDSVEELALYKKVLNELSN